MLSDLIYGKERKWWKVNCYVLAERPENSDGGLWDSCWQVSSTQGGRTYVGSHHATRWGRVGDQSIGVSTRNASRLTSLSWVVISPAWPPQTVKAEGTEGHCRTAMTKGLNPAAPITASVGSAAHLKAKWSVLPISYVTHWDNGLFAFLPISLCEDDKFIESNCEAFVQSGGVSTWLEGSFARINPEWKRRQGIRSWWSVLTDILGWSTSQGDSDWKKVFVVNITIWDSKEVAELLPCVMNLIPCRNPSDRLWLVEWVRLIMIWIIYITEIFLWGFCASYRCLGWTFRYGV